MDHVARGWLVAHAKANIWKLRPHLELHDLVQEGFLVLLKVERAYPQANQRQHMALLKRSFTNRIIDLQRAQRTYLDSFSLESELDLTLEYAAGGQHDPAHSWAELPADIQEIATTLNEPRTKPGRLLAMAIEEHARVRVHEHLDTAA